MDSYPKLAEIVREAKSDSLEHDAIPYLIDVWLAQYWIKVKTSDVVETRHDGCSYIFDVQHERLIAAWAISSGRHSGKRDAHRMRRHPQGFGSRYHRGHAIPHSAGGPTDINLVPQLGSINVGSFRVLEKEAVASVGSLYFTHWIYADESQKPISVEQGLLRAGCAPAISVHSN
jgi:hypothetical protein